MLRPSILKGTALTGSAALGLLLVGCSSESDVPVAPAPSAGAASSSDAASAEAAPPPADQQVMNEDPAGPPISPVQPRPAESTPAAGSVEVAASDESSPFSKVGSADESASDEAGPTPPSESAGDSEIARNIPGAVPVPISSKAENSSEDPTGTWLAGLGKSMFGNNLAPASASSAGRPATSEVSGESSPLAGETGQPEGEFGGEAGPGSEQPEMNPDVPVAPGAAASGTVQQFDEKTAEYAVQQFILAVQASNPTEAAQFVSPRAKKELGQLRDGTADAAMLASAKEVTSGVRLAHQRDSGDTKVLVLKNSSGHTLTFRVKKEEEGWMINSLEVEAPRGAGRTR